MITLERASRWYGDVVGINDVSCQIMPGITALLGPNGAGKSTMIKLITGQLRPTAGRVSVLGFAPFANPNVFRRLGYCPETENSYDELSGRQMVTMLGVMSGLKSAELKARVSEVIDQVGMTASADRKIGGYSKGMRQRIKIAQGIIHDPDILILDEPLNGLDPLARRDITTLLHRLSEKGKCIIVSSHILYEVEQMTQNILLMSRGKLLAQGDFYAIRALIDSHPHRITIRTLDPRALGAKLLQMGSVLSARLDPTDPGWLEVETSAPEAFYTAFPEIVLKNGIAIESFASPDNNLESVFQYLVNG